MLRIGVLARAPHQDGCKPGLLAAHGGPWVAGLYAAMLRDTLDGLLAIDAADYVVHAPAGEAEAEVRAILERHVPSPWRIRVGAEEAPGARLERALAELGGGGARALVVVSDVPSLPTEPLAEAMAVAGDEVVIGPSEDGGIYAISTRGPAPRVLDGAPFGSPALVPTIRARCIDRGVEVRELPTWYDVDRPSDVLRLQDELRRFPERAPRTAQYFVTAP